MEKRIQYIDCLRGFTMILVVFSHVEIFGLGVHANESLINSIFMTFRMPVFFFISGYIGFKDFFIANRKDYCFHIGKKARIQLIPAIIFFILFSLCKVGADPLRNFLQGGFQEYWFGIVLLEMFVVYYTVSFIFNKRQVSVLVIVSLLFLFINTFFKSWNIWWQSLCLNHFFTYFQFFVFGLLARKYNPQFISAINKEIVRAIVILSFIVCLFIIYNTDICKNRYLFSFLFEVVLVRYLGVLSLFIFFHDLSGFFEKDTIISKGLTYIGRRTYDIYLLHYFFIPSLFVMKSIVEWGILIEFLIILFISILTVGISLLMSRFIRSSSLLSHYLFGVKLLSH